MLAERRRRGGMEERSDGWSVVNKVEQVTLGVQHSLVCCSTHWLRHTHTECGSYIRLYLPLQLHSSQNHSHIDIHWLASWHSHMPLANNQAGAVSMVTEHSGGQSQKSKADWGLTRNQNRTTLKQIYTSVPVVWSNCLTPQPLVTVATSSFSLTAHLQWRHVFSHFSNDESLNSDKGQRSSTQRPSIFLLEMTTVASG